MSTEQRENSPQLPPRKESKVEFLERLNGFGDEDRERVMFAYDLAKAAHRGQERDGGERYFEHPRAVSLILMDECQIVDPWIISASLLHDAVEDTIIFGSYHKLSYSEWIRIARYRIEWAFNDDTADIILSLTQPKVDGEEILTKKDAEDKYFENLRNASSDAILVKMADRLHNLRTLNVVDAEKRKRKIEETTEIYYPIFEKVGEKYPEEYAYLQSQIEQTISQLQEE